MPYVPYIIPYHTTPYYTIPCHIISYIKSHQQVMAAAGFHPSYSDSEEGAPRLTSNGSVWNNGTALQTFPRRCVTTTCEWKDFRHEPSVARHHGRECARLRRLQSREEGPCLAPLEATCGSGVVERGRFSLDCSSLPCPARSHLWIK